jgi:phage gpG-like protein
MADNENIKGVDEMKRKLAAAQLYIQQDVPVIIGIEAVKHFKNNFMEEGFDGKKWASRKSKRMGSTNGQKVLSMTGELAESIDYKIDGNTVTIYSDKPYAKIHNEGGKIQVTDKMKKFFWAKNKEAKDAGATDVADMYKAMALSSEITIQQRMFIGDSQLLITKITQKVTKDLNRILK